jgi:hypothetical protein
MFPATAWLWRHNQVQNKKKYCLLYFITLNSNCKAQRASKNLKKILEDELEAKNNESEGNFLLFKGEKYVSKSQNKIRQYSPKEKLSRYLCSTNFCT